MVWELIIDNDRLGRIAELVFDVFELGNSGALGDVERTVRKCEAVRPIEPRSHNLELALAPVRDHRINLVENPVADKDRSLLALPQRARVRHATHEHLDLESLGQLELRRWQLVCGHWKRRRIDAAKLAGRIRGRLIRRWRRRRWRRLLGGRGPNRNREHQSRERYAA